MSPAWQAFLAATLLVALCAGAATALVLSPLLICRAARSLYRRARLRRMEGSR